MADKKTNTTVRVEEIVKELQENGSSRFSKTDFQTLVFGVLADETFKAKKHLLKGGVMVEEEAEFNSSMKKFLDKLLKHAGIPDADERAAVINSFEYTAKDVEWITDCVDEAMYLYTECDKNMRMFRDKMLQLTIRKMKRSGVHEGKITYKKSVVDKHAK